MIKKNQFWIAKINRYFRIRFIEARPIRYNMFYKKSESIVSIWTKVIDKRPSINAK